jgi:hypothetical protein
MDHLDTNGSLFARRQPKRFGVSADSPGEIVTRIACDGGQAVEPLGTGANPRAAQDSPEVRNRS